MSFSLLIMVFLFYCHPLPRLIDFICLLKCNDVVIICCHTCKPLLCCLFIVLMSFIFLWFCTNHRCPVLSVNISLCLDCVFAGAEPILCTLLGPTAPCSDWLLDPTRGKVGLGWVRVKYEPVMVGFRVRYTVRLWKLMFMCEKTFSAH